MQMEKWYGVVSWHLENTLEGCSMVNSEYLKFRFCACLSPAKGTSFSASLHLSSLPVLKSTFGDMFFCCQWPSSEPVLTPGGA